MTILTAALNSGATIKNTLESVRNQTLRDFEHVVIDSCKPEFSDIIFERP
ncbi:glycosyltransferase [Desulfosarcina sp. BuS5]